MVIDESSSVRMQSSEDNNGARRVYVAARTRGQQRTERLRRVGPAKVSKVVRHGSHTQPEPQLHAGPAFARPDIFWRSKVEKNTRELDESSAANRLFFLSLPLPQQQFVRPRARVVFSRHELGERALVPCPMRPRNEKQPQPPCANKVT